MLLDHFSTYTFFAQLWAPGNEKCGVCGSFDCYMDATLR